MKVLFSLTYYLPYVSGLSIYAQRLADGLTKKKHKIEIFTSRYSNSLQSHEIVDGINISRIWSPIRFHKGLIMPTWPIVSLFSVFKNDVVICHLPEVEGVWLLFWAKLFHKKTICVYHCDVNLPNGTLNRIVNIILFLIDHLCLMMTDVVVNSSKDYSINSPVLKHYLYKLKVIYPPIVVSAIEVQKKMLPISFYAKKIKIGFVGRMAAEKGIEYLLETIPFLKKHLLSFGIFIVGPQEPIGEEKYICKIDRLIKLHGKNVEILGKLPSELLTEFYKNIDLLVLPSVNSTEAFGMVQAEAMLSGTPVVASNLPGVREAIRVTGMGLITKPGDVLSLEQSILSVINNPKKYIKSLRKIKRCFSSEKTILDFEKLIKYHSK